MKDKVFERIVDIGIILMIISFNPFVLPGIYLDSFGSFSFISTIKIIILAIVNLLLSLAWIVKIRQDGKLLLIKSKIYIPVLLWLFSNIISAIFSENKNLALFGSNSTLESSFIESVLLFIFFFLIVNNIRSRDQVVRLLRALSIGVSVTCIYQLIRFSFNWNIGINYLENYLNQATFNPIGFYGTSVILATISFFVSISLTINDIFEKRARLELYTDIALAFTSGLSLGVFINISSLSPQYNYLFLSIIGLAGIAYFLYKKQETKIALRPILIVSILSVILGICLHYGITRNVLQPYYSPTVTLQDSFEVSRKSADSAKNILIGNGQGTYTYLFDKNKPDVIAMPYQVNGQILSNFSINSQSPITEEVRSYQSFSYFLGILSETGFLGLISFVSIIGFVVFIANKERFKKNFLRLFVFSILIGLSTILIFAHYDFIVLLSFWLLLGVFIMLDTSNEEIEIKSILSLRNAKLIKYFFPGLCIAILSFGLIATIPILASNFYLTESRFALSKGDLDDYKSKLEKASNISPDNQLIKREYLAQKANELFVQYDEILRLESEDAGINKTKIESLSNKAFYAEDQLISQIKDLISKNKADYKNYYFAGIILSRSAEVINNKAKDLSASEYFNESINRNPHHADSYYQLSKVYYRNGKYTSALNTIPIAINLRSSNLTYTEIYADILKSFGSYEEALKIYNSFKYIKEQDPSNQAFLQFYNEKDIEKDITEVNKKIEEKGQSSNTPNGQDGKK